MYHIVQNRFKFFLSWRKAFGYTSMLERMSLRNPKSEQDIQDKQDLQDKRYLFAGKPRGNLQASLS